MTSRRSKLIFGKISVFIFLIFVAGCSPKEITIDPPYLDQKLSASELIKFAKSQCKEKREAADKRATFTTDGCSMVPNGWGVDSWRVCCVEHDIHYWCGGSREDRVSSDQQFEQCVAGKGYPRWGKIMYLGVRAGGHPIWPFPWRWGYGWDWYRGYERE